MSSYTGSHDEEEQEPFLPAYGRGVSEVEGEEAVEYLNGARGGTFRNLSVAVNVMLVCVGVAICVLLGMIIEAPVPQSLAAKKPRCEALMLLIRHAEKMKDANEPGGGTHISKVGKKRAEYLGHCMTHKSPAFPWGAPSVLMSVTNQSSGSTRPYETLLPLSHALKKDILEIQDDDYEGLMDAVDKHVGCGETVLVAWHHSTMMELVEAVMPSNFWMYDEWPAECPSEHFVEPKWLPGSTCYDIILSMPLREKHSVSDGKVRRWWPGWMDVYHEGFGGEPDSKCKEDLRKLVEYEDTETSSKQESWRSELRVATAEALEKLHTEMEHAEAEMERKAAELKAADAKPLTPPRVHVDVVLE
mmetsp:Transcript_19614/g.46627  ORF Transcript_19614/g.46627 Transcript_19614/m.46627 type:complete len:359 (+) Transcript_19614:33-1109(+)|eukprot:CAMPEP_0177729696 /NCGR_PEP_ID=MMETSP0484_2-20121128/21578_1 /TAXON_ID=354590 /ORGANISM="Rhodomonas lens, Strain RHODO" /LENGTH=358 /DNA_ID=CAMNT_0019242605 /DNA_START=28 /DNA_END=1104 /DNA_ORIENTATION=-